ncbi:MAG: flagellar protein FlaG [Pseudomonadota bacterium]
MDSNLSGIANSGYPPVDISSTAVSKKTLAGAVDSPTAPPNVQDLPHLAARLLQVDNQSLQFSTDHSTGKIIVKVIDQSTGDILRQIPSEDLLEIAKSLDQLRGLLINAKA